MTAARKLRSLIGLRPTQDQDRSPRIVRVVGNITLMEAWTSDNPDRIFTDQTLRIREESKSSRLGRDGRLIVTCRPMNVIWYEAKADDFRDVVFVKIVTRGQMLVEKALDGCPRAIPGGVSFDLISQP